MSALFRHTICGTVVRFATNGALLAFPTETDPDRGGETTDSSLTSQNVSAVRKSESENDETEVEVGWNSESDPENPQNWSLRKKSFVASLICIYTFSVYCGSSIYVPSEEQVMEEFGVSETVASLGLALYVLGYGLGPLLFSPLSEVSYIGRNPIYIITFVIFLILMVVSAVVETIAGFLIVRFLQGIFGSPCLATGAASLGDMFPVTRIPYPLAAWSGAMYAGPALGPLLSGFSVPVENWRWSMWEMVWLSAIVLILLFCFLPETAAPTLLHYRTQRLNKQTGKSIYVSSVARASQHRTRSQAIQLALVKPFEITLKDPAIAFINLYTALTYGIYYSFFEVFPLVYPKMYGMNLGETSAVFVCVLIACILGTMWYCLWYLFFIQKRFDKLGTFDVQETFLRPGLIGVFGVPIGLFLFGWAARPSVPWPVPTLGILLYTMCGFVVGLGIFIHLPCSYAQYSASLFAANDALRSAFASGAILFGRPLYVNLGVAKGCSLLGSLSVLGIVGFWYLFLCGEKLRKKNKFMVAE